MQRQPNITEVRSPSNKEDGDGATSNAGLTTLDTLGLAHNQIREIPGRVFSHLAHLTNLELDGNQITHVDPDAFIGLEDPTFFKQYILNNLLLQNSNTPEGSTESVQENAETSRCMESPRLDDYRVENRENIYPQNNKSDKFVWNHKTTKLFLSLYEERKNRFRDPKIKKKVLWAEINNEFKKHGYETLTEDFLDRKLRNMKKTYRTIKENKNATGRGRIHWEYFEEFENIFSNDKTINYGPTISSLSTFETSTPINMPISICTENEFLDPDDPEPVDAIGQSPKLSITSNVSNSGSFRAPSAEPSIPPQMSSRSRESSVSSDNTLRSSGDNPPPKKNKALYDLRKKLVATEEERVKAINKLTEAIVENNTIQRERNVLIGNYLKTLPDRNN